MSTLSTAALNAACNAAVDLIDVGAGTATCVLYAGGVGGTVLATFNLPNPAFGAASSGAAALLGVPLSTTATGTGTCNAYEFEDRDGTGVWSGSVGTSGTEIVFTGTASITSGQTVNLNTYSLQANN